MRVREVEEMIPEVRAEIMKKFPGTNKHYAALLSAFGEACEHVRYANLVIDELDVDDKHLWKAYGMRYVGHWVIRKIAEQLGVPNEVVESTSAQMD